MSEEKTFIMLIDPNGQLRQFETRTSASCPEEDSLELKTQVLIPVMDVAVSFKDMLEMGYKIPPSDEKEESL